MVCGMSVRGSPVPVAVTTSSSRAGVSAGGDGGAAEVGRSVARRRVEDFMSAEGEVLRRGGERKGTPATEWGHDGRVVGSLV